MNLDNTQSVDNTVNNVDYKQVGAKLNEFLVIKGKAPMNLKTVSNDEVIENSKSFSGADVANGSGLIQTSVISPLVGLTRRGGVFIESGANFVDNASFDVTFGGVSLNGSYLRFAYSVTTANEISSFTSLTLNLLRERAEIVGAEDVLARNPNASQAISIFEQLLENEKLRIADVKAAAAITGNASVANIDQTTPLTQGQISGTMATMSGNIGGLETIANIGHAYYMNQQGFNKFLREQSTTGAFINSNGFSQGFFEPAYVNGKRATIGLVGYFNGFPVYLNGGILNTYAVNATTKAITAQTGGTSTAVLFGLPNTLGIGRGDRKYDTINIFDSSNDRASYYEGSVTVGAVTRMAAGVIIPAAWNLATIAA